mmetsp:Transcript_8240/g.16686  ORF Transcript_8240/g.16686 Transcript_8240/m.16686 type:complete len:136 (-) Transcript_8240:2633-3040(-)
MDAWRNGELNDGSSFEGPPRHSSFTFGNDVLCDHESRSSGKLALQDPQSPGGLDSSLLYSSLANLPTHPDLVSLRRSPGSSQLYSTGLLLSKGSHAPLKPTAPLVVRDVHTPTTLATPGLQETTPSPPVCSQTPH